MKSNNPQYVLYIERFKEYLQKNSRALTASSAIAYLQTILNSNLSPLTKCKVFTIIKGYCSKRLYTEQADILYAWISQARIKYFNKGKARRTSDTQTLSYKEVQAMLRYEYDKGKAAALTSLFIETGIKVSDATRLKRNHMFYKGDISVFQIAPGRQIEISAETMKRIDDAFPHPSKFLISSIKRPYRLSRKSITRLINQASEEKIGRRVNPELLRATHIKYNKPKTLDDSKRLGYAHESSMHTRVKDVND